MHKGSFIRLCCQFSIISSCMKLRQMQQFRTDMQKQMLLVAGFPLRPPEGA